uniref:hypothetical protein n=3 Tax=Roseivirga sp. TaxID=1964215 RepID=UPI00404796B9
MEAIIFMPGLGSGLNDQSLNAFAYRYVKAVDINDPDEKKKFSIKVREENYGVDGSLKTKVAAVYQEFNQTTEQVIDIYEFDYIEQLTADFKRKNVISKILMLSAILVINIPKTIYFNLKRLFSKTGGISEGNTGQFLYASFILFLLAFFGLLLIASFPVAITDLVNEKYLAEFKAFLDGNKLGQFIEGAYGQLRGRAQYLIGFFALFYLVMPDFKLFVVEMATEFICMIQYLSVGKNRLNLTGKFEELLEKVSEDNNEYDKVTVIAYSFGSIVALDTIFPMKGATSFRVANKITGLVTIGCPYDFVNLYWKSYFTDREFKAKNIRHWHNLYSTADILSSNFRKDSKEGTSEVTVVAEALKPTNLSFNVLPKKQFNVVGFFLLSGIRAHGMYWEDQLNSASCLTTLVSQRLEDESH